MVKDRFHNTSEAMCNSGVLLPDLDFKGGFGGWERWRERLERDAAKLK